MESFLGEIVRVLIILVLVSASFIITTKHTSRLFWLYSLQSLLLSLIAFVIYIDNGVFAMLALAIMTFISKVVIIPFFLRKVHSQLKINKDANFHYLQPAGSILVSIIILLAIYGLFSRFSADLGLDQLSLLGAVLGLMLVFMGMIIVFSREQFLTNITGYLVMENGVLLFTFFFPEMPFIIEVLIILDLIMLIVLTTILVFGIYSTIEEFHKKIHRFSTWFNRND